MILKLELLITADARKPRASGDDPFGVSQVGDGRW